MIDLTFPDGAVRSFDPGITGRAVAESLSKSLAKKAVAYAIDGTVRDLSDPLGKSGKVEIITRDDPRYYEGIVATSVLGGGYSARLNEEIRIKRGLSYGANASLSARRASGAFSASAQTKNQSAGQVVSLIETEMTKLGAAPASPEELTARKSGLIGGYGRSLATTDGLADILGTLALYHIDLGEIGLYTGKVDAVGAGQVQDFARQAFDPAQSSVIVVGDASKFGPDVKTVLPNAETVPVADLNLDDPSLRKKK